MILLSLIFTSNVFSQNASPNVNKTEDALRAKGKILEIVRSQHQNNSLVILSPQDLKGLSPNEINAISSPQGPCDTALAINFGQTVNGQLSNTDCLLSDGSYTDLYAFNGTQGQEVTVAMNSAAFDAFLGLVNQDTFEASDDNSGGGSNARITATLPTTGIYIIFANSFDPAGFGDYTLSLNSGCTFTLTPASAEVPGVGGTFTFQVETQAGCRWSAYTSEYSDVLKTSSSGTGPGTVEYTVGPNGTSTRTLRMSVAGQIFTVTQQPLVCSYSIDSTSASFPGIEGTGTINVVAPAGCPWAATTDINSFIVTSGYGRGSGSFQYLVLHNNGADRTAKLHVGGLDFTVTQAGLNCTFSVSQTDIPVDRFEHTGTISVTTQPNCEWSAGRSHFWVELENGHGFGSGTFNYRIYADDTYGKRDSVIGFYGIGLIRIYIRQSGIPLHTVNDFDGDGKSDVAVFRPSNAVWYMNGTTAGFTATSWGNSTDKLVPADYDGDRKTDLAVYRDGNWYIIKSSDNTFIINSFGQAGDIPQPADFDGDGKAELAVYRPQGGYWYSLNLADNQFNAYSFGNETDQPEVSDYDGDGKADFAVYRAETGTWYMQQTTAGFAATSFGIATDKPIPADYDGDGKTDVAVYRDGNWYELKSSAGFYAVSFGDPGDLPTPGDYDGDGKMDEAVYRNGQWFILQSAKGVSVISFGDPTDKPIENAYLR